MSNPSETKPWDRLPDEPIRWYAHFETYRLIDPTLRSIVQAWRKYQTEKYGEPPAKNRINRHWYEMAKRWNWRERAEAWDEYQLTKRADYVEYSLQLFREALPLAAERIIATLHSSQDTQARLAAKDIINLLGLAKIEEPMYPGRSLNIQFVDYKSFGRNNIDDDQESDDY